MSKAWFKPNSVPNLIDKIKHQHRSIEIWNTTCIVQNFGKSKESKTEILINPCNPQLSGVKNFPYFPRGGPVPKDTVKTMHASWQPLGFVSNWGGMEVGNGMMYPVSVIDGLVHQLGGWRFQLECVQLPVIQNNDEKCPIGHAVKTSNGNKELLNEYDHIIHTTPPFYSHYNGDPIDALEQCYKNSIKLAFAPSDNKREIRVACPILGSGARGFPMDVAMQVAAKTSIKWIQGEFNVSNERSSIEHSIAFGFLERKDAIEFKEMLQEHRTLLS